MKLNSQCVGSSDCFDTSNIYYVNSLYLGLMRTDQQSPSSLVLPLFVKSSVTRSVPLDQVRVGVIKTDVTLCASPELRQRNSFGQLFTHVTCVTE